MHEEADTSIIYYAAELHKKNLSVHIYSPETNVMVMALAKIQDLNHNTVIIMGSSQNRQWIPLLPIYRTLGDERVHALMGFHALSGCDTTGCIFGKSKSSWWAKFVEADGEVIWSFSHLGIGDTPTPDILNHCERFICNLLSTTTTVHNDSGALRWHYFRTMKASQGVEKLPPTQGAMHEHICRAHLQCHIWQQAHIASPTLLDATTLGWSHDPDGKLVPLLTRLPLAPESVLQLVKCGCTKSKSVKGAAHV